MMPPTPAGELGSVITRRDMRFHQPNYRDYRWLETNGYSFTIPQARIGAHLWNAFRTNLNVVESRVMVWSSDDPHAGVMDLDYLDDQHHIPMPPDQLDNFRLKNGLSVRMTVPLLEWDLRYDGAYDTVFDLHLRGLCPPLHISETGTSDGERGTIRLGHLDQMMMITGTVRLLGRDHEVSWPSWRDHSWSPRPEGAARTGYAVNVSANFDYGAFGEDLVFHVQTTAEWDHMERSVVDHGYIIDRGETLRLKHGEGRYVFDDRWTTVGLEYELEDERGRTHLFVGEPKSFYHMGTGVNAVVQWRTRDGDVGWGQYDWHGNGRQQRAHKPPVAAAAGA
jgi:hypothetical protein